MSPEQHNLPGTIMQIKKETFSTGIYWIASAAIALLLGYFIAAQSPTLPEIVILLATTILFWQKPILGIYLIIFLPVLGEFSRLPYLGENGILLSDLIVGIYIGLWIIKKLLNFEKMEPNSFSRPLLFFSLIGIFSLIQSLLFLKPTEALSGSFYLIRFIEYTLLALSIPDFVHTKKQSEHIVVATIISAVLIALGGFIQLVIYPDLGTLVEFGWDPHRYRLVSTWMDPNFVGGFFSFILMICFALFLYAKENKPRLLYSISIIILSIALFLTYSRSGYIAFAVGLFVLGLLKSRKLIILGVLIAIIGLSFSTRAQERITDLVHTVTSFITNTAENPDATARLRIKSWQQTLELIQKRPLLGSGYNTLRYVKYNEGFVQDPTSHSASGSDSSLLTILATTGILGLIPFLLLYWNLLKVALRNWQDKLNSPFKQALGLGLLSGTAALMAHSVFVNSLLFPQIMIFLWIYAGIVNNRLSEVIK